MPRGGLRFQDWWKCGAYMFIDIFLFSGKFANGPILWGINIIFYVQKCTYCRISTAKYSNCEEKLVINWKNFLTWPQLTNTFLLILNFSRMCSTVNISKGQIHFFTLKSTAQKLQNAKNIARKLPLGCPVITPRPRGNVSRLLQLDPPVHKLISGELYSAYKSWSFPTAEIRWKQ